MKTLACDERTAWQAGVNLIVGDREDHPLRVWMPKLLGGRRGWRYRRRPSCAGEVSLRTVLELSSTTVYWISRRRSARRGCADPEPGDDDVAHVCRPRAACPWRVRAPARGVRGRGGKAQVAGARPGPTTPPLPGSTAVAISCAVGGQPWPVEVVAERVRGDPAGGGDSLEPLVQTGSEVVPGRGDDERRTVMAITMPWISERMPAWRPRRRPRG